MLDLTTLEKVGQFPHLQELVRVYHHKKGLHIVVMYLVIGDWRFPWSFRVYRGKDTPSPSQLGQKLLRTLPKILTQSFQIYVLGDTAFGTINLINQIRGDSFNHHGILGIGKNRTLEDGRKVSELKTRGQQVYLNDLDIPVFLSWVWLKRDGKRVQRFVISTKPMKGKTIAYRGKKKMANRRVFRAPLNIVERLHRFGQKTLQACLSLVNSFFCFLFISLLGLFTLRSSG